MTARLSPQREAAEAAVTSLVNGGYSQQIAREILSGVRAEVRAEAAAELAAVRAERDELTRRDVTSPLAVIAKHGDMSETVRQEIRDLLAEAGATS